MTARARIETLVCKNCGVEGPCRLGPGTSGFSLIECLVALALAGLTAMLLTIALHQQSRSAQRLRVSEVTTNVLEAALETVRAGSGPPPSSGLLLPGIAYPRTPPSMNMRVTLLVAQTEVPDLYDVTVEARYSVLRETRSRQLHSLIWRPQ